VKNGGKQMVNYLRNFDFGQFIKQTPKDNRCCPDQVVGFMRNGQVKQVSRQNIEYQARRVRKIRKINGYELHTINMEYSINNKLTRPVAIVLESPHDKEFNNPIGPAKDATGRYFFLYFEELIKKSVIYKEINTGEHDIVFMNSIQYQCSLGKTLNYKTRIQRDINWISCFEYENSCDIEKRLQAINPVATINLCTKGNWNLQMILDRKINQRKNYTYGTHPYSWTCEKNRFIR